MGRVDVPSCPLSTGTLASDVLAFADMSGCGDGGGGGWKKEGRSGEKDGPAEGNPSKTEP